MIKNADGASWKRSNWPIHANGELVSALDGDWSAIEKVLADKIAAKGSGKSGGLSEKDTLHTFKNKIASASFNYTIYKFKLSEYSRSLINENYNNFKTKINLFKKENSNKNFLKDFLP